MKSSSQWFQSGFIAYYISRYIGDKGLRDQPNRKKSIPTSK